LLNKLAGRKAAIVSPIPGTTRDLIQVDLSIEGLQVSVTDTAGLRATYDAIESAGIGLAKEAMAQAHIILYLTDAKDTEALALDVEATPADCVLVRVQSKCDLSTGHGPEDTAWQLSTVDDAVFETFYTRLAQTVKHRCSTILADEDQPLLIRARHRQCLHHASASIDSALVHLATGDAVLAAEELRRAAAYIGQITGKVIDHEEILSSLFSTFCIGK
jgi:tRNA modification GTPase